jgi:hypothetical protein
MLWSERQSTGAFNQMKEISESCPYKASHRSYSPPKTVMNMYISLSDINRLKRCDHGAHFGFTCYAFAEFGSVTCIYAPVLPLNVSPLIHMKSVRKQTWYTYDFNSSHASLWAKR